MSAELSLATVHNDWVPVADRFAAMRAERDELERRLVQTLDKLEGWQAELQRHQNRLDAERIELQRECELLNQTQHDQQCASSELANQCADLRGELGRTESELAELRDAKTARDEQLQREIDQLQERRQRLESERDEHAQQMAALAERCETLERDIQQAREQSETSSHTAEDHHEQINQLNAQCDQIRNERDEQAEQNKQLAEFCAALQGDLDQARAQAQASAATEGDGQADVQALADERNQLRNERDEQAEQIRQLAALCVELEDELEQVRDRAAVLTETLEETRQNNPLSEIEWGEELKRMRQAIERSAGAQTQPASATAPADQHAGNDGAALTSPERAVLGSVLAQFETVRRSRAAGRKRSNANSS